MRLGSTAPSHGKAVLAYLTLVMLPCAGGLPPNQWADLYSESGPDGVGDLGQEPTCTLYIFDATLNLTGQVPCLPHKVGEPSLC